MLILHGNFDNQNTQFRIWAEQDSTSVRKKGRQSKIAPHPFSVPASELRQHLLEIVPYLRPQSEIATMWLPSAEKSPQPSPELAATGAFSLPEQTTLMLESWRVAMIMFSLADAVDLLLALNETVRISADIHYWRQLTIYPLY